jgi:hypoxanthine-DNA glycosylase
MQSVGFPPIAGPDARVLILGSLPGQTSLAEQEYYAQPRNVFWTIMGALFEAGPSRPYTDRIARLIERQVAVWDVCAGAWRAGSLDASIDPQSVKANDFVSFYAAHPHISFIAFNGAHAATLYRQHVLPTLSATERKRPSAILPSTSPTHAAMSLKDKLTEWQILTKKLKTKAKASQESPS